MLTHFLALLCFIGLSFLVATKGITIFNIFIRFGLGVAYSNKVWKSAQWGIDIKPKTVSQLSDLWSGVKSRLIEGKEFGGYNAIVYLAGEKTARLLLEKEWVKTRGVVAPITSSSSLSSLRPRSLQASSSASSLGKRCANSVNNMHLQQEEEDIDDDGVMDVGTMSVAPPPSRRPRLF